MPAGRGARQAGGLGRTEDGWPRLKVSGPLDPWKHPYVYQPHPDGTYRVISYGEDGRPGGEGLSADIDNVTMRDGR
jgi:hypothetical protein